VREIAARTRGVEVVLDNRGRDVIELANGIAVERLVGERWESVSDRELSIVNNVGPKPPDCVRVEPGASLTVAEPWLGTTCFGFCPCHANAAVAAGTYRVVAYTCARDRAAASGPLEWRGR
jgi:hypothetical protein